MASKRPQRRPINIDDDADIDFSAVAKTAPTRPTVSSALLQHTVAEATQKQQDDAPVPLQAVDPRLNSYTHRAAPRRRVGFGAPPAVSPAFNSTAPSGDAEDVKKNKELLDAFWREDAARQEEESHQTRRERYEKELRALCCAGSTAPHQVHSLLDQFFADGVPDVEPWDLWALSMPRYSLANLAPGKLDCVHHPVLPETHYSQHYHHRVEERPAVVKVVKTREELRAERRERLRKAKEERDRARRAARQEQPHEAANVAGVLPAASLGTTAKDRLTNSNLRFNLFDESVMNPLSTENKIFSQYQERFFEHQRRNYERHVAAIPQQIEKRNRDLKRHAEEQPVFRAYRIFPIFTPAHLGKLRNFANDGLLRGFVLWICQCDALVVLAGGEVAVRHLERWILEKMRWDAPETTAVRLMTCPLQDAATFSFVSAKSRKRERQSAQTTKQAAEETRAQRAPTKGADGTEHVYMNFVDSVQEGESFMRSVPTEGPWRDLSHVWRAALAFGVGCDKDGS
ncbi:U4/U6 small nuclear ribonucleoprotein PRP3 [Trypanosoma rangeli]|uniref:U4/U6 small nuclear ribonucleoprotein PRP3 n=1 Tax=Trypanosoma rangeli TaxID=5698 RepID=A0A3R7KZ00_TRYRA|nr:U4/U6 small nuclear ribonucleoprotein PRP3 [Trypanosoma rangeli]RNF04183.1 U4/U6 small nuclear ribonucleoprotein PRP3 [Trypanosoma rangeli]|eukprot:RNF04183.1 U4/U6 small nuclear ribonucleoprotein PRP3 [Trypanosoma rangeli]